MIYACTVFSRVAKRIKIVGKKEMSGKYRTSQNYSKMPSLAPEFYFILFLNLRKKLLKNRN